MIGINSLRNYACCLSNHFKERRTRRAAAKYQSPTAGPRSISPASPGGVGKVERLNTRRK